MLAERRSLPPALLAFCWVVLALLLLSLAYCAIEGLVYHAPYPYSWPLFQQGQEFTDFTIYLVKFQHVHHAEFFTTGYPFTYPAPMALLYALLFRLPPDIATDVFLSIACASFVVPSIFFGWALKTRGLSPKQACGLAGILLVTSWPAALLFDRANVEVFVWIALLIAVWALATGREWLAAAMFGVAASLKLFPVFFLALFLSRSRWPKLLLGLAVFAAATLLSLAVLGPTVAEAYQGIAAGLRFFNASYTSVYSPAVSGLDHSILGLMKTIAVLATDNNEADLLPITSVYMPVMAALGTLLYCWRIRTLPWLNQLLLLSLASILFTPFSGDGTLIHLYCSFALCCFLVLAAWRQGVRVPGLHPMLFCFAYLFAFESFEIVSGRRVQAQGKCLVLIALFVMALRYPLGLPFRSSAGPKEMAHPEPQHIADAVALERHA